MTSEAKTYKLKDGRVVPAVGFGTYLSKDIDEVVYKFIQNGARLIDTASFYKNEEGVGKGINKAIADGVVKREDLFVITKMWRDQRDDPEKAIKESLEKLKLAYVDLYLDHWPTLKNYNTGEKFYPIHEVWPKMESLVEKGYAKHIGVSNYNVQSLCNLLSFCKIRPEFNEVEFNPYLYQKNLKDFCDKEGILLLAYNPMVRGSYVKAHAEKIKELKMDFYNDEMVKELAKKYNKTVGQILLNWFVCIGVIPIPGSSNPERMKENIVAAQFKMAEEDVQKISALNKNYRFCGTTGEGGIGFDAFA